MMAGRFSRASAGRAAVLAIAVSVALSSIVTAGAVGTAQGVVRQGACVGGPSHWRLRVLSDGAGVLVVRFRLVGGGSGETWNLFLDHDGAGFFAGSRVSDDTGLVRVRRRTEDLPGFDVIRAAGHDVATGEICRGRVRI
jgi:hypothetical protein